MAVSAGIKNAFQILDIDDDIAEQDPYELLQALQREAEKENDVKDKGKKGAKTQTKKTTETAKKPAAVSKTNEPSKVKQNSQQNKPPRLTAAAAQQGTQEKKEVTFGGEQGVNRGGVGQRGRGGRGGSNRGRPASGSTTAAPATSDSEKIGGFGVPMPSSGNNRNATGGAGQQFRGGNARGRGTGGRGGAHPFERHSGSRVTGVKATEKRHGSGSYNWGTETDQYEGEVQGSVQAAVDETNPDVANDTAEGAAAPADPEAEVAEEENQEPENKQMSVEEYLRAQQPNRAALIDQPASNKRKPKVDLNKVLQEFKKGDEKLVAYQKNMASEEEEESEEEDETDGKRKNTLDYKMKSYRGGTRFNDRGGSGRGRGGFQRGGGRGGNTPRGDRGRPNAKNINIESAEDFPALQ